MTNFETSAWIGSPFKALQARMSFHSLSPTRKTSFEWYAGFVGILDCVAWVSSMRHCSISVQQGSLSFALDVSRSKMNLWDVTHPRSGSSLGISLPKFSIWVCRGWILYFNSMCAKKLCNMNLKNWSNFCSFWDCRINSGIWISTRMCVFSLHAGVRSPKPSSTSAMVL